MYQYKQIDLGKNKFGCTFPNLDVYKQMPCPSTVQNVLGKQLDIYGIQNSLDRSKPICKIRFKAKVAFKIRKLPNCPLYITYMDKSSHGLARRNMFKSSEIQYYWVGVVCPPPSTHPWLEQGNKSKWRWGQKSTPLSQYVSAGPDYVYLYAALFRYL